MLIVVWCGLRALVVVIVVSVLQRYRVSVRREANRKTEFIGKSKRFINSGEAILTAGDAHRQALGSDCRFSDFALPLH